MNAGPVCPVSGGASWVSYTPDTPPVGSMQSPPRTATGSAQTLGELRAVRRMTGRGCEAESEPERSPSGAVIGFQVWLRISLDRSFWKWGGLWEVQRI